MLGLPIGVTILVALYIMVLLLRKFLVICRPDEIVVIEGRRTKLPDGSTRDYAVIDAGRAFRIPVIENARAMDLSTMTVEDRKSVGEGKRIGLIHYESKE